jgi:hypothetical protein
VSINSVTFSGHPTGASSLVQEKRHVGGCGVPTCRHARTYMYVDAVLGCVQCVRTFTPVHNDGRP